MSETQLLFLSNIATAIQADQANGLGEKIYREPARRPFPVECGCRDCEAAVSPAAYLADLLDYTVSHVKDGAAAVTLDFLARTFGQPFAALPASCGAAE